MVSTLAFKFISFRVRRMTSLCVPRTGATGDRLALLQEGRNRRFCEHGGGGATPDPYWGLTGTDWEEIRARSTTEFGVQSGREPCPVRSPSSGIEIGRLRSLKTFGIVHC